MENIKLFSSVRNFQHENLVQLYGVCTSQGPVFILMELVSQGVCVGEEVMCVYVCLCVHMHGFIYWNPSNQDMSVLISQIWRI